MRSSIDPTPRSSEDDVRHAGGGDPVPRGHTPSSLAVGGSTTDVPDLGGIEFPRLSGRSFHPDGETSTAPSLGGHVLHVVGVGPKEKMVRVDASGNIAPMADLDAFGDRTSVELPSQAMRSFDQPSGTRPKLTVAMRVGRSRPEPAPVSPVDLFLPAFAFGARVDRRDVVGALHSDRIASATPSEVVKSAPATGDCGSVATLNAAHATEYSTAGTPL